MNHQKNEINERFHYNKLNLLSEVVDVAAKRDQMKILVIRNFRREQLNSCQSTDLTRTDDKFLSTIVVRICNIKIFACIKCYSIRKAQCC